MAERRAGTTVSCPRCQTRVVVPAAGEAAPPTRLEGRDVERSLAQLEPAPGGTFAEESFVIPAPEEPAGGQPRAASASAGVTLPRWALYALLVAFPAVAVVSFLCGCLWMAAAGR